MKKSNIIKRRKQGNISSSFVFRSKKFLDLSSSRCASPLFALKTTNFPHFLGKTRSPFLFGKYISFNHI